MIFWLSLLILPYKGAQDPAPGLLRSKRASRRLECARVSPETGSQSYPGQIEMARPRGDYVERSVMICRERLLRPDLRAPQDEAILSDLGAHAVAMASAAEALRPDLGERTWLVETHYPSAQVSAKVAFATKNALVRQGLKVSDRTPVLAVGDVEVITRMDPESAYPVACRRYAETGALGPDQALLAVVSLDPRETILHAGLCDRGTWSWLQ